MIQLTNQGRSRIVRDRLDAITQQLEAIPAVKAARISIDGVTYSYRRTSWGAEIRRVN